MSEFKPGNTVAVTQDVGDFKKGQICTVVKLGMPGFVVVAYIIGFEPFEQVIHESFLLKLLMKDED